MTLYFSHNLQPETILGIVLFTLLFAGTIYALKKGSQSGRNL